MLVNLIAAADCYKFSHPFMIIRDISEMTSYIEPRSGSEFTDEIMLFGVQAFIRKYLNKQLTLADIDQAERWAKSALIPFNREMWLYVVNECNGFIPVQLEALPEGTVVKHGVPVVQVTYIGKPKFVSIVAVIETALLRAVWYPSTVASNSRAIKKELIAGLAISSDLDPETVIQTMLNDFGARGVSSAESAAIGGLAHAVNFLGSDTFEAIQAAEVYYDHDVDVDGPVIISVPATEHSVTTVNGEEGECEFIGKVIDTFTDMGFPIISLVADSYDFDRFVLEYIGGALKDKIEARPNGFIVVRPDSGEPTEIVPHTLRMLDEKFGSTVNQKGFKVLNPKVRVIQGDGINMDSIKEITAAIIKAGYSTENVVFGMGGQLLQAPMRDDFSWAMKTNEAVIDGQRVDVQKRPKTDMRKASKAGKQAVVFNGKDYVAIRDADLKSASHGTRNYLEPVWRQGKTLRTQTLNQIRELAKI
jgi:nicotinamide phosphoribosyltransferase